MLLQTLAVVVPCLFALLVLWLLLQLLQKYGQVLLRLEALEARIAQPGGNAPQGSPAPRGLTPGTPAPAFELPDLSGQKRSLQDWRGQNVLLVFFNIRCGFCVRMADRLAGLAGDGRDGRPVIVLIADGEADDNRRFMQEHGVRCPVLLQKEREAATQYRAGGTPMGYLIDSEGVVASPLTVGADDLLALAAVRFSAQDEPAPQEARYEPRSEGARGKTNRGLHTSRLRRDGLKVGETAPDFTLPRLHGGELSLRELRGRQVLLVFSDPECGPCMELAPRLEQFHKQARDIQVVMISRRSPEANSQKVAQLGLTFPVVLQRQWEISLLYGMFSTPIAYLIDGDGVLATDVVAGAPAIGDLLTRLSSAADASGPQANGAFVTSSAP